jgi:hypothetical protein
MAHDKCNINDQAVSTDASTENKMYDHMAVSVGPSTNPCKWDIPTKHNFPHPAFLF